jgi:hypothetical protein
LQPTQIILNHVNTLGTIGDWKMITTRLLIRFDIGILIE